MPASHDIILGLTTSSQAVTLHQCRQFDASIPLRSTDTPVVRLQVRTVFSGCHFADESQMRFASLSVRLRNLEEWTNLTGLSAADDELRRATSEAILGYKYDPPRPVVAKTDDVEIRVKFLVSVHDGRHEVRMTERAAVTVIPREPILFQEFMRGLIYNVQNFICLGIGAGTAVTALEGEPASGSSSPLGNVRQPDSIKIAFATRSPSDASEGISSAAMLFTLRDIASEFGAHMSAWLSKAELLQPVYDLYFGVYYNPTLYVNLQFLSYAQALETYHRRAIGGKYMSDDGYSVVRGKLADAVPADLECDFKASIRSKLQYLHEYSLRKRLIDLFERFLPIAGVQLPNVPNLVMDVVSERNYLTHYEKGLQPPADARRTFDLAGLMKLVVEAIMLTEIGFTPEMVARAIKPDFRYVYMLDRLSGKKK